MKGLGFRVTWRLRVTVSGTSVPVNDGGETHEMVWVSTTSAGTGIHPAVELRVNLKSISH